MIERTEAGTLESAERAWEAVSEAILEVAMARKVSDPPRGLPKAWRRSVGLTRAMRSLAVAFAALDESIPTGGGESIAAADRAILEFRDEPGEAALLLEDVAAGVAEVAE